MLKKALFALCAACLMSLPTFASPPSESSPAAIAVRGGSSSLNAEPIATESALLTAEAQKALLFGVEVSINEAYRGPLPLRVQVDCFGKAATPSLAVDAATYGQSAKLLNLTNPIDKGCNSYRVAVNDASSGIAGAGPAPVSNPPDGIAVGVHHWKPEPADVRFSRPGVFVFNPVHGHWTEAKPYSAPGQEQQRAYATLSENHQRIIGGVIALPEALQGQPASSTPASLSRPLERVSPLSGYLGISSIEPDSKGAYGVDLPLLLRPTIGPGPSFSIRYGSHGLPGVLGRGWDLVISTIEVKGPAPLYHPSYETEDYVLDGMDLIPVDGEGRDIAPMYKGGPILPRVSGVRIFRLRDNSDGLIVRRYGRSPNEYFWEVWNPNAHTTRLYGGELPHGATAPVASAGNGVLRGSATMGQTSRESIGQWALTQEYDNQVARNGAKYHYAQDDAAKRACTPSWGTGECKAALRLELAEYNLAFGLPSNAISPTGVTRVTFKWTGREQERFNSDGRLGFLRTHEFWLTDVLVHYQPLPNSPLLTAADTAVPAGDVLFAAHSFELTGGDNACMNFDRALWKYKVIANAFYNEGIPDKEQVFTFNYEGERHGKGPACSREWAAGKQPAELGTLPASAVGGNLGFPTKLLEDTGFGLLTRQSLLGTSRTEESGASLYVGVGPVGDTSSKGNTGGLKAGVHFSKSEGNSTLVDVTGDGIDDIVFRDGERVAYCAGQRSLRPTDGVHEISYPPARCGNIEGITDFSVSNTSSTSVGGEGYPWEELFFGVGFTSSHNDSYVYFTDRDGDGLVDVVAFGRVLYNQGEVRENGKNIVRFVPNSALLPPIPGHVAATRAAERSKFNDVVPPDLKDNIRTIEARLSALSARLKALAYTQTTIAWEAPLDGVITVSGQLRRGTSRTEPGNEGALGETFGPTEFERLFTEVARYNDDYVARKFDCALWPEDGRCHAEVSDPLAPHYGPGTRNVLSFIGTPPAEAQLSVYRRRSEQVVVCGGSPINSDVLDLADIDVSAGCRSGAEPKQIRVRSGDVLYLAYSIHPHFRKWVKPELKVSYVEVEDDAAFALARNGDSQGILSSLKCNWKDVAGHASSADCLLARQARYEFSLAEGTLPSAPNATVGLPPGTRRTFGGRFLIPADLAKDYQVYFDVVGERQPDNVEYYGKPNPKPSPPAASLRRLFRQDVSALCSAAVQTCTVDIALQCDAARPSAECADFFGDPKARHVLAARLVAQHREQRAAIDVRNIGGRLSEVAWQVPPHVRSLLVESGSQPTVEKETLVYLPLATGDPDLEFFRVEAGIFQNPSADLNEGVPDPKVVDFRDIVAAEQQNVELARVRQTIDLCRFADELLTFRSDRVSRYGQPYTEEYGDYWKKQLDAHSKRCDEARQRFKSVKFTNNDSPRHSGANSLRLPEYLRNLPYAEQITSAETLLDRVLANLARGDGFLTDSPRLTRRGYRLPVKVNPLDCRVLASDGSPLDSPIVGEDTACAYRLSTNFAMHEFEDLVDEKVAKNMRAMLARFANSTEAAFEVVLSATLNGRPLAFRELSGEPTGNDRCTSTAPQTCIGSYGTREPVEPHLYPPKDAKHAVPGDMFQRLGLNRRTSRAVAFSNAIMDSNVAAACTLGFPLYQKPGDNESKQDCPVATETAKYTGAVAFQVRYTIGENNHFVGRNRVLEFDASPLDILELHFRLSAVDKTVERDPTKPGDPITGRFTVFDTQGGGVNVPMGLQAGRHIIPRSPSDILPGDVMDQLACPPAPANQNTTGSGRLWSSCRPWTRLGWTEVLLGAQYRTYSDAQVVGLLQDDLYSIKRRREVLRLQPELEVEADKYMLELQPAGNLPMVGELGQTSWAFFVRDPNVAKIGGLWSFIGARAAPNGALSAPPPFVTTPGSPRLLDSLRYGTYLSASAGAVRDDWYSSTLTNCGVRNQPDFQQCEGAMSSQGEKSLSLDGVKAFALIHRFVGPVAAEVGKTPWPDGAIGVPETAACSAETPTTMASCWKGVDDTVFLESAIDPLWTGTARTPIYSVSALLGFERPPLLRFVAEFDSYRKLVCLDPDSPSPACPAAAVGSGPGVDFSYPNRPTPPDGASAVALHAPVLSSETRSVSWNEGVSFINLNSSRNRKDTTRTFLDVNGDGVPDIVSGSSVELTSPVGLSRRDWWRYFRLPPDSTELGAELQVGGYDQHTTTASDGHGIGLSPHTFAVFKSNGSRTRNSGSPDAKVDPSFDFSLEKSKDTNFVELRDFNGDGLPDKLEGGSIGDGLRLAFNVGNGLRGGPPRAVTVDDQSVSGIYFNTSHASGFGVRLGFSARAGSILAGMGLSHQDIGSQAALMDFTGDGRPDIVLPVSSVSGTSALMVFPNLGNGFGPPKIHRLQGAVPKLRDGVESGAALSETTLVDAGTIFTTGVNFWLVRVVFSPGVKWSRNQTRELLALRDVNGDGVPDLVAVSGDFVTLLTPGTLSTQVHYNPEGKYHFLAGVTNPSGSQFLLRHGLVGNSGPEHGRPVWALTAVARYDGYEPQQQNPHDDKPGALMPDGQDVLLTTYKYSDGYYNRAEKQFYGFAKRTSTTYGCDLAFKGGTRCLDVVRQYPELDPPLLEQAGYRPLQIARRVFSNLDFLTQGRELSNTVSGFESSPALANASVPSPPAYLLSRTLSGFSIDNLASLTGPGQGQCRAPPPVGSRDSWGPASYAPAGSALSPVWDGRQFIDNGMVLGPKGACGEDLAQCQQILFRNACNEGFVREQSAFWAQQSGSVRQRLTSLETFAGDLDDKESFLVDLRDKEPFKAPGDDVARLRSAVAFNHDQWGQILSFNSIGEASAAWKPGNDASSNASIVYVARPRPAPPRQYTAGYPLLGLAEAVQVFSGAWSDNDRRPIRAREAVYSNDGHGNLTDVCLYPGAEGFIFNVGMCEDFRKNMQTALSDRYSSLQAALRKAYADTVRLPAGESVFNAVIHHRIVAYDKFGQPLHTISPVSQNKEWIERRYRYDGDPFRRTATSTLLTRCIQDVPGAGDSTAGVVPLKEAPCTLGLPVLPDAVQRKPVVHASSDRIDSHFGVVAQTRDINGNGVLFDFDGWGRLGLVARDWGNAPVENRTFENRLQNAVAKDPRRAAADWRLLALVDYARLSEGLLRSNLRKFEPSNSYAGLLEPESTTRESASFTDGLGQPVQTMREADVCLGVSDDLFDNGKNIEPSATLRQRCKATDGAIATPGAAIDALGRELETFESYTHVRGAPPRKFRDVRFTELMRSAVMSPRPVLATTYDGGGRPRLIESRLREPKVNGPVLGSAQYRYRIVPENGEDLARFESLSLSPRCAAGASWTDARGLTRTLFEDQKNFHPAGTAPAPALPTDPYRRDHTLTKGYCKPIEQIVGPWAGAGPARVAYAYDSLQQLSSVDYPLDDMTRTKITVRRDLIGRPLEMREPNTGCTRYTYDSLSLLTSEAGYRYEDGDGNCGSVSSVRNEKAYLYAADRLIRMSYHSLEEQGGAADAQGTVQFYHDRFPYAARPGEVLETLRFVPNDQANQRFVDVTGRKCDNCIGQVTVVSDRSGARSFSYNELGLAKREVRSVVAPLRRVKPSGGNSEAAIPEVAFIEVDSSYSAFGDPIQERLLESAPMNPALACLPDVHTCTARFTIGRKYAPDGAIAQLLFNGRPLINGAQDVLARPAVRWTSTGVTTGYRYDPEDLRLNQMATLTAAHVPVQAIGYQYDGDGNILGYDNRARAIEDYESQFNFTYDPVGRLKSFEAKARKGAQSLQGSGAYTFDAGHRFRQRTLSLTGTPGTKFERKWTYDYHDQAVKGPLHAPRSISFSVDNSSRETVLSYDDIGRLTRIGLGKTDNKTSIRLLSNRSMVWDAEGRLLGVRGVKDDTAPANESLLLEDYVYDFGGNRVLKMHKPRDPSDGDSEAALIYLTPFYARPYDGRGTVQLAQGTLPAASLIPSADQGENSTVTFLYTDLPVGSMTASVTSFGEATDANSTVIGRREYEPFGLELTVDGLADTGRRDAPPLSVFHGKELDLRTGYSSFGARTYSRDLAVWLKADPLLSSYLEGAPNGGIFRPANLSVFMLAYSAPVGWRDPTGRYPDKTHAATLDQVIERLNQISVVDAAGKTIKNIGTLTGAEAHAALVAAGRRNGVAMPNILFSARGSKRYLYTEKEGWVDMQHFLAHAGQGARFSGLQPLDKLSEMIQDKITGYAEESYQLFRERIGWDRRGSSAFHSEDIPSDQRGYDFGAWEFSAKSSKNLGQQLREYLNALGPKKPEAAPDWNKLQP